MGFLDNLSGRLGNVGEQLGGMSGRLGNVGEQLGNMGGQMGDRLNEALGDQYGGALNRGRENVQRATRKMRLRSELSETYRQRNEALLQLGMSLYPELSAHPELSLGRENLIEAVRVLDERRSELERELAAADGSTPVTFTQAPVAPATASNRATYACPSCGSQVVEGDIVCLVCGARLDGPSPAEPQDEPLSVQDEVVSSAEVALDEGDAAQDAAGDVPCGQSPEDDGLTGDDESAVPAPREPDEPVATFAEPDAVPASEPMAEEAPLEEAPTEESPTLQTSESTPEAQLDEPTAQQDAAVAPTYEPAIQQDQPVASDTEPSAPALRLCPVCSAPVQPGDLFCMICGTRL